MAFVFHVEFGMNDTPLTQALEQGNYATAERFIIDCPNASYLDDGCYQRTPLYICLCGVDEFHQRVATRNFYLAQLLIERGANVNHRVPVTNFGSEYISPGKSSLELLVDFFIDLTRVPDVDDPDSPWHPHQRVWNPLTELVVGLNKQYMMSKDDVKEDVKDLIFSILRHGGDANVLDEGKMTVVHRLAMYSHDMSLLSILCDNGADISMVDGNGNTPLLALCNVAAFESDNSYDVSPASESDIARKALFEDDFKSKLSIKYDFLHYLLKRKETDVNHQNNFGQTALFHCILREDLKSAKTLLDAGASPSLQCFVWETRRKKRKLSALFASFMTIPLQQSLLHSSLYEQATKAPQPISYLVDSGYFNTREVNRELSHLIEHDFPEFSHLQSYAGTLTQLMFGYRCASLKQLAARKVFQCCFIESTACLHTILPVSSIQENFLAHELLTNPPKYEEYITLVLNCTVLRRLLELVQLPHSLLIHFEAQLLYLRMSLKFCALQAQRPMHNSMVRNIFDLVSDDSDADDSEDANDDSSGSYDSSTEEDIEGDSDLEYW
ncbi:uncharacterized protein LOC131932908 [Physella acuta]|uniref:uncharacterized protein LOC131932908 n=1 Tax=Physella acuta TaxID=109671 RepID=UPI0027DDCDE0|nr:uncharacterized protein LOC131932908 [Physella acuta]